MPHIASNLRDSESTYVSSRAEEQIQKLQRNAHSSIYLAHTDAHTDAEQEARKLEIKTKIKIYKKCVY